MEFIDIAKEFLLMVSGELDPYTTRDGEIEVGSDRVTLFTPAHIQFAKYGRGPGKKPPLDPILAFVKEKGIIFDNATQRGTAFAIMNSISKKGTSNWVPDAPNALDEAINKNLEGYYKDLSKIIFIEQTKELDKLYEKQFGKEIEFKI